jgi:hypothetical protein
MQHELGNFEIVIIATKPLLVHDLSAPVRQRTSSGTKMRLLASATASSIVSKIRRTSSSE